MDGPDLDELTDSIDDAIDDLMQENPQAGFIIIAALQQEDKAEVTLVSNLSNEDARQVVEGFFEESSMYSAPKTGTAPPSSYH